MTTAQERNIPVGDIVEFPADRAPRRPASGRYIFTGSAAESMTPVEEVPEQPTETVEVPAPRAVRLADDVSAFSGSPEITPDEVAINEALPPILPRWMASKEVFLAQVKAKSRYAWHAARWHALRSPVYGTRAGWRMVKGATKGVALGVKLVAATEYAPLVAEQVKGRKYEEAKNLRKEWWGSIKGRLAVAGGVTLGTTGGVALAVVMFGAWILAVPALAATLGAYMAGRREDDQLLDVADLPVKVNLSSDQLNDAFRAAGLLKPEASLMLCGPIIKDGEGWATVIDLPRGGGKTAADVLAKRAVIAAELGVDEIQVIMTRVRAAAGGHAGRLAMWVADDDPYLGDKTPSPLVLAEKWNVWDQIPFGQDARGRRVNLSMMWQSMFLGGLPRRGKTFAQRLISAAGVLDPHVRHYVADGKGGADWKPMEEVAHRYVCGAEDDALEALEAMLEELIADMERRFKILRELPMSVCPEGKLTPEISRRYGMPVTMITIDELQEYLTALSKEKNEKVVDMLCRVARRGPAAGFIIIPASQRPDAESVPTKLREIISMRYCTQVVDRTSSDMVLGKGKAAMGADASVLHEDHMGVGVLVTGPGSYVTVRVDYMDVPTFATVCARGRELREKAGTLSGEAAGKRVSAAAEGFKVPPIISDVLEVMRHVDRMHTDDILQRLADLDEGTYGDFNSEKLAAALETAGVDRTSKQVKIDNVNRNGWRRADLEAVLPNVRVTNG